jgi:hypothetical protein
MVTAMTGYFHATRRTLEKCILTALALSLGGAMISDAQNTITDQEKKDGWRLLWDGKTTEGWRSGGSDTIPAKSWTIRDGVLLVDEGGQKGGGDIITKERFSNFELTLDFIASTGCNSGIKYFVQTDAPRTSLGSVIGLEFQILDDANHPDAKAGRDGNRTLGSLYDLFPATATKKVNPVGQWNTARIVVNGNHVEHWLNGEKILQYERGSQAYREAVKLSKFNVVAGFGEWPDGHILLQEHGENVVSFRNIKIRVLSGK